MLRTSGIPIQVNNGCVVASVQVDLCKDVLDLFRHELLEYCEHVEKAVNVELEQCMFDSLVSWTYNLGPTNLNSSTLLKFLNAENYEEDVQKVAPVRAPHKKHAAELLFHGVQTST